MLFFDDDDRPRPTSSSEHLRAHERNPEEATAILGHTDWAPELEVTPLMHYVTEVDQLLFAYGNLEPTASGSTGGASGRAGSRASASLLLRHGLHDQRLDYSIDVEMAWRLAPHGLEVVYEPAARSFMARPLDFDALLPPHEAKGRAQAAIAALHPDAEIARLR